MLATLLQTRDADSVALIAEPELRLTYGALEEVVSRLAGQLRSAGLRRSARVAIAVSNGPAAAIGFLAAARAGIAAPLNPAYTRAEFSFALNDLPATLLLADGTVPAAQEAARALGVPVLRLGPDFVPGHAVAQVEPPEAEDIALVLHTSGTTGRPKRVPLTHANLFRSAENIAQTLRLSPADRCLNVMPLFHIHGLIGAVLSSLSAGGSVVCTPGFDAFRFFDWLEGSSPTWYTAVPSMHQAIAGRGRNRVVAGHGLRFVRSSSSAMPPSVQCAIEELFGVPLIEAYGMTEAAHQIASNGIQRDDRRTGSVGRPGAVEVQVAGPGGMPLANGSRGEVVIRGASVTSGYEAIPASEFTYPGGWLRTGDEGYLDEDGFLFLTGRLKEIINRGGEKVSPREVEDALLAHPAVAEAMVFAIPHASLGEEVGAAVRIGAGEDSPGAAELRAFAARTLAPFKVPRKIVFVEQIPLGPTGKPQRIGMAGRLGLA